ncbi:MAG: ATP:cob(I)alamin adenosyltransferase [Halobacteriovoraceae bacterium]|nr:ATP:cob(I)alamin adenosyltransferase [Halobacteriovoraceae bacterium]
MTNKSSIYTKSGDKGKTSLVGGKRVSKSDISLALYGEIDELNSWIGVILSEIEGKDYINNQTLLLKKVQVSLFNLGSNFACEPEKRKSFKLPQLVEEDVLNIENEINEMDSDLKELKNFILPGGSKLSSFLHILRTVCRRVERILIAYSEKNGDLLPSFSGEFINRLSDYFFVFSRWVNFKEGREEELWKPSL